MEEATTLDVSFEEPETVPGTAQDTVQELEPEPETEEPEVELEPVKRKRAPRRKLPVPESSSDEEVLLPPPLPKKTRAPKPRVAASEKLQEEPLTYLQVLQRGLVAVRATDKANKVARYDAYFAHLH